MMDDIAFGDVVAEVGAELEERLEAARAAGCHETWADPGIGFGKKLEHNLRCCAACRRCAPAGGAGDGRGFAQGVHRPADRGSPPERACSGRRRR